MANGTGNGYRRGNGGNLEILDKNYRKQHGMGRQREPRDWVFFSPTHPATEGL